MIGSTQTAASRVQPALSVETMVATPGSPQRAEVGDPDGLAKPEGEHLANPSPSNERVQLAIDALQNYELLKPIPVVVESLSNKLFIAEAPDLNISMSDTSLAGVLLLLKDHITTIYEEFRMKKTMNPKETRQLEILQMYIGKTRRNWR
jgi:hypothetical protein